MEAGHVRTLHVYNRIPPHARIVAAAAEESYLLSVNVYLGPGAAPLLVSNVVFAYTYWQLLLFAGLEQMRTNKQTHSIGPPALFS